MYKLEPLTEKENTLKLTPHGMKRVWIPKGERSALKR